MGSAGFEYSWKMKKTEMTAQDRTGREKWSVATPCHWVGRAVAQGPSRIPSKKL